MSEKNPIKRTIDEIEPDAAAKTRMFANIQRKAAEADARGKTEKTKILRFNHVMKWALPIAACLVIVVAGVIVFPHLTAGKKAAQYDAAPYEPMTQGDSSPINSIADASQYEKATSDFEVPNNPAEDNCVEEPVGSGSVTFVYKGHEYRQSTDESIDGDIIRKEEIDEGTELTVIRQPDTLTLGIIWWDGDVQYLLSNADGATEEELIEVYQLLKENQPLY